MIVDMHSHAWDYTRHFSPAAREQARAARGGQEVDLTVRYGAYRESAASCEHTVVFGGKARLSGLWVEDDYVAQYVAADPQRLTGFLSVDPTQPGWQDELHQGHQELGLKGIKLLPMYAGFFCHDQFLDPLWEYATEQRLPVILHAGTTFISQAPLECTLPRHLDNVARRYPDVTLVLAHLGHPYEGETVAVIRKHPHVYADISALHYRPFQLYHSLMLVQEYGVWSKVLFGTDYPFTTVDASVAGLRQLNEMLQGTALPRIDDAGLEGVIHQDSMAVLGLRE